MTFEIGTVVTLNNPDPPLHVATGNVHRGDLPRGAVGKVLDIREGSSVVVFEALPDANVIVPNAWLKLNGVEQDAVQASDDDTFTSPSTRSAAEYNAYAKQWLTRAAAEQWPTEKIRERWRDERSIRASLGEGFTTETWQEINGFYKMTEASNAKQT